jgi:hypothetical protein
VISVAAGTPGNHEVAEWSITDTKFQRAAETVAECRTAIKELARLANDARLFREKCSLVLGSAYRATLALQEVSKKAERQHIQGHAFWAWRVWQANSQL